MKEEEEDDPQAARLRTVTLHVCCDKEIPSSSSHIIHDCPDFRLPKGQHGLEDLDEDEDTIKVLEITKLAI